MRFAHRVHALKQPATFVIVGTVSGAVYLSILWLGHELLHMSVGMAHTLGYVSSIGAHFMLNHRVTFGKSGRVLTRTIARYIGMLAFCYLLMFGVVFGCTHFFQLPLFLAALIALVINALSSYQLSKRWVF